MFTVWISRLPFGRIVEALRFDSGPPLVYFLEKPVVAAAERLALSDAAARLLPFLAVAALFLAGRGEPAGVRRRYLLLAAFSPFLLFYSSEARAYGVLALLAFALFRLAARERQPVGVLTAIVLLSAAAAWTHYLGVVLVLSLLAGSLLLRRLAAAGALALGLLSFLPWAPVLLAQPPAATSWIRDSSAASLGGFLAGLGGSLRVLPNFGFALPTPLLWLAGALGITWIVLLLVFLRTADPGSRLGVMAVFFTLGAILVASLWRPIAVAGRSEMVVLPIWLWLAARAGEESRAARSAAIVMTAVAAVSSLLLLFAPRAGRPFAEVPDGLLASARPGDVVLATANFYLPAALARDRGLLKAELRPIPPELGDHPGWFRGTVSPDDFREIAEELSRAGPQKTVHLLMDSAYRGPRLRELLEPRGPFRESRASRAGFWIVSPAREAPPR